MKINASALYYDRALCFEPLASRNNNGVLPKMANQNWPVYGEITGPIVMIGFGSIGRGTLPLIERHFKFDKSRMVVIDPRDADRKLLDERGIAFVQEAVTKKNYKKLLTPLLTKGGGQGFCVNLSVDTSLARPDEALPQARRALRRHRRRALARLLFRQQGRQRRAHQLCAARDRARGEAQEPRRHDRGLHAAAPIRAWSRGSSSRRWSTSPTTSASKFDEPAQDDREGWAKLMKKAGVKGIHIAERDTQRTKKPKPLERVLEHLVGRGLHLGRPAAGRTRLGHA